jgi:hypothetical protein
MCVDFCSEFHFGKELQLDSSEIISHSLLHVVVQPWLSNRDLNHELESLFLGL